MDGMRELLRRDLGRSLKALPDVDRLRAAWTVACGRTMASHGRVTGFDAGILEIEIEAGDDRWLGQMLAMRGTLERDVAAIAKVKLTGIHFYLRRTGSQLE